MVVFLAVIWKNLLLRRNHWVQTIREIAVPLAMLLLVNLYLPPIPNMVPNDYLFELTPEKSGAPAHSSFLIYNPSNNFSDALMKQIGLNAGYKLRNVKPSNITSLRNNFIYEYGIEFGSQEANNTDQLNYIIYPGKGIWPRSLPIWHEENSLVANTFRQAVAYTLGTMQHVIDSAFLMKQPEPAIPKISAASMDTFSREGSIYGFLVITSVFFAYTFLVAPVITRVCEEKQCGAKELMRMMGVKSWELWLAKIVDAMTVVLLIASGMTFLLFYPLTSDSMVIVNGSPFTFWLIFVIGMLSVVISLFFISCWFDSPTFAATFAQIIGVGSAGLLGIMATGSVSRWRGLLYCLLPHMSVIYATQVLMKFEQYGKKVNWTERLSKDDSALTLSDIFLMMIFDIWLYGMLTWYCDKVRPGKFGIPLRWNFFLQKYYWSSKGKVTADTLPLKDGVEHPAPRAGVSIQQLRKVYKSFGRATLVAVDGVSLEAPEGRITALLGHNGAGKTTTMNIITGLIAATSGTVIINGHDIRINPDAARRSLGLCPQRDLLFHDLTAYQTLTFYGMIKGMSVRDAGVEADSLLEIMKMKQAKHRATQALSGGMKRKLSLGIAIIGGSKVLILDEPTAGVDPELRREICDLLLSYRGHRTILLTTHIMEEADAISDLIHIMEHGKVQCSGTPLDLKTQFGTGYTLQVFVKEDGNAVTEAVHMTVPDSRFKARNAATLTFQLPAVQTPTFPSLFEKLDALQKSGEIVSYSVSISTLEDVFVRVREIEEERKRDPGSDEVDSSPYELMSSNSELNIRSYTGCLLLFWQLYALIIKKVLCFRRGCTYYFVLCAIPIILMIVSSLIQPNLASLNNEDDRLKFVNYSSHLYPGMEIMYSWAPGCVICRKIDEPFKILAEQRGFHVSKVLNVTEASNDLFLDDFHQYSRYLALTVELSDTNIILRHNSLAAHILSVGINIVNNAFMGLLDGVPRISTATNLTFVPPPTHLANEILEVHDSPTSSFPDVIGIQTLFYIISIQTEILYGAKALQIMIVPSGLYWLSHIFFDLMAFLAYIIVSSSLYYYFEPQDAIFNSGFSAAVILWGVGLILISYLIACFTKTRSNAISIALLVYYVFSSFVWTLIEVTVLPEWMAYLHPTLIWKLAIFKKSYKYLFYLLLYDVFLFSVIIIVESTILGRIAHWLLNCVHKVKYTMGTESDSDVLNEEQLVSDLVAAPENAQDVLLATRLRRWFGIFRAKPAVQGVSFRVKPGECFGLLGVNGAGKSTTFNMLAAQIACSEGDAVLNDDRLADWFREGYLSRVSYCPQSSGIIPDLEGGEFLALFARLRGLKTPQVASAVRHWIKVLDLADCASRLCGRYSGGMERKLSAAVAFMWDAKVVMLDEPTSGVDPVARRSIWKAITLAQESGKSVVLTSHSMEECEALCSRLAIMVNGSFRCIGETTTLKNKFGGGYSVQLKVASGSVEETKKFETAVVASLGEGCRLTDRHCSILHYHIKNETTNWKTLFTCLEELKSRFAILESYIASETTLEEIFLAFAGHRLHANGPENIHCVEIS